MVPRFVLLDRYGFLRFVVDSTTRYFYRSISKIFIRHILMNLQNRSYQLEFCLVNWLFSIIVGGETNEEIERSERGEKEENI